MFTLTLQPEAVVARAAELRDRVPVGHRRASPRTTQGGHVRALSRADGPRFKQRVKWFRFDRKAEREVAELAALRRAFRNALADGDVIRVRHAVEALMRQLLREVRDEWRAKRLHRERRERLARVHFEL